MKTEDIDKRIGMPDVDAEWARFEQEVIGKETKASKRSLYSWIGSFAIAASVVIVAGLFFLNHDSKETEQILTETSEHPISHDVVSEPSSSEKPTELIAKTSPTKQVKIRRENNTATDYIYDCDEESAVFPGGEEALKAFIEANLELPDLATEYGAKGRIFMSFVIDSVGEVSDIRILERPRARISYDTPRLSKEPEDTQVKIKELITLQLGEEGTRILSLMPRWRPAIWGGKPRKTRYHLPINFDATKVERQELLAKNQDIKPESLKDLDKSLQGQIAGFNDLPPQVINLGSGYVMRNLGYKYRIPDGEPLLLINGELFPDSVKQTLNNTEIGHLDKFFVKFFKQRHQELENIKVLKEEEARHPYMEKFGDLAQYGVINITTSPDTLCDYYMNQHEELKASRYRISGIVLDEDNKPLPHTMIAVVKEGNKIWGREAADSTGHFAFWAPRTGVTIHFSYVGFYKVVELKPTDKPLTIRMRLTKDAKKVIKNISFE